MTAHDDRHEGHVLQHLLAENCLDPQLVSDHICGICYGAPVPVYPRERWRLEPRPTHRIQTRNTCRSPVYTLLGTFLYSAANGDREDQGGAP